MRMYVVHREASVRTAVCTGSVPSALLSRKHRYTVITVKITRQILDES